MNWFLKTVLSNIEHDGKEVLLTHNWEKLKRDLDFNNKLLTYFGHIVPGFVFQYNIGADKSKRLLMNIYKCKRCKSLFVISFSKVYQFPCSLKDYNVFLYYREKGTCNAEIMKKACL